MHKLRSSLFILTVCAAFSCSMSAKTDKVTENAPKAATETTTSAEGEVINMTKAEFLTKIFNYEKNPNKWVYEGNKPVRVLLIFMPIGVDLARLLLPY